MIQRYQEGYESKIFKNFLNRFLEFIDLFMKLVKILIKRKKYFQS